MPIIYPLVHYINLHLPKVAPSLDFFPYVLNRHLLPIMPYRGHKTHSVLVPFYFFGNTFSSSFFRSFPFVPFEGGIFGKKKKKFTPSLTQLGTIFLSL